MKMYSKKQESVNPEMDAWNDVGNGGEGSHFI